MDAEKKRRQAEILAWLQEHPDTVRKSFLEMPQGDVDADALAIAVVGGIFSGIAKLWDAMKEGIPDLRLEELAEVMFGDAEYWANRRARSPKRPPP